MPSTFSSQPVTKHPPKPVDTVLAEAEAQWLFTESELAQTPSILDGMAAEAEREMRTKGLNFIMQIGIMLKLPQITLSTAGIFFNRFLMRNSLVSKPDQPKALHHYVCGLLHVTAHLLTIPVASSRSLAIPRIENRRKLSKAQGAHCRLLSSRTEKPVARYR